LAADRPLAAVFRVETLVSMAILREWAINLRLRVALERVAHPLCEVFERLRAVGLRECGKSCGLTINDLEALKNLALFSPSYLHLRAE
jgi:hypothetical protein